ncbi:hypothetical protein M9H77_17219 [Catharanthus roseus]|uniref:Uncharacterized protein n=1 Tax=Catharanthus roseus TaxID=4058 RepID=A0ACC0B3Y4_CATRO|nr:hypothetical protein M9H77_17219 [Catharanthus roseus]
MSPHLSPCSNTTLMERYFKMKIVEKDSFSSIGLCFPKVIVSKLGKSSSSYYRVYRALVSKVTTWGENVTLPPMAGLSLPFPVGFYRGFSWELGTYRSRSYEHNSYDCYKSNRLGGRDCYNEISCKGVPRNEVRNGGNYVNVDERFHKRRDDCEGYNENYNYGGYNYRRSSQTLGTISRHLSCNKLKLLLLRGTFGPYDYEAWEQKVESLFYSYCVKEEEKFKLVLKSLSYEVNVWWDCKCESRRRIGAQQIKTWNLMKQSLRNKFRFKTMKDKDKVKQMKNS